MEKKKEVTAWTHASARVTQAAARWSKISCPHQVQKEYSRAVGWLCFIQWLKEPGSFHPMTLPSWKGAYQTCRRLEHGGCAWRALRGLIYKGQHHFYQRSTSQDTVPWPQLAPERLGSRPLLCVRKSGKGLGEVLRVSARVKRWAQLQASSPPSSGSQTPTHCLH